MCHATYHFWPPLAPSFIESKFHNSLFLSTVSFHDGGLSVTHTSLYGTSCLHFTASQFWEEPPYWILRISSRYYPFSLLPHGLIFGGRVSPFLSVYWCNNYFLSRKNQMACSGDCNTCSCSWEPSSYYWHILSYKAMLFLKLLSKGEDCAYILHSTWTNIYSRDQLDLNATVLGSYYRLQRYEAHGKRTR